MDWGARSQHARGPAQTTGQQGAEFRKTGFDDVRIKRLKLAPLGVDTYPHQVLLVRNDGPIWQQQGFTQADRVTAGAAT